jgi:hypothetical protein
VRCRFKFARFEWPTFVTLVADLLVVRNQLRSSSPRPADRFPTPAAVSRIPLSQVDNPNYPQRVATNRAASPRASLGRSVTENPSVANELEPEALPYPLNRSASSASAVTYTRNGPVMRSGSPRLSRTSSTSNTNSPGTAQLHRWHSLGGYVAITPTAATASSMATRSGSPRRSVSPRSAPAERSAPMFGQEDADNLGVVYDRVFGSTVRLQLHKGCV